jgi:hypothetical protein
MYNEYVFQNEVVEDDKLHSLLFDAFYSDLCAIGVEGFKQIRKTKAKKIEALERCLKFYEENEMYERCSVIKNILDQIA